MAQDSLGAEPLSTPMMTHLEYTETPSQRLGKSQQKHTNYFILPAWFWQIMCETISHQRSSAIINHGYLNSWESLPLINSSPPGQNGRHVADDVFKCIFLNEKFCILIRIALRFVPKGPIDNKSALVQVMAWHPTGDKQLLEPMLTQFTDAYMRH